MKIVMGSDAYGFELKEFLKGNLTAMGHEVLDETPENNADFVDAATKVAKVISDEKADRGIIIDEHGVGSFMTANKFKGIICANVTDEHSAFMTRGHNSTKIITIGAGIVGKTLANEMCKTFVESEYDGGRHQIRVDMLNKMV